MITFNADEVFEMAEQIERNGAKFYRKAAASADAESAAFLEELAEMEDRHEETFHDMRQELSQAEKTTVTFDPEGEGVAYLRAMADGKVFNFRADPSEKLTGQETPADIFHTAIGLEKDSVVFYLGMKAIVPDTRGRERVDGIIKEEMGHIMILSEKLSALT